MSRDTVEVIRELENLTREYAIRPGTPPELFVLLSRLHAHLGIYRNLVLLSDYDTVVRAVDFAVQEPTGHEDKDN